ncbi:MAG TPA: trigger factor [bacterium]|nr:trigger factor [bacterium]
MEVKANRIDNENIEIEITAPKEMVDKAISRVYQQMASGQAIKGFRKGKVPREVIKSMVGEEGIAAEALHDLLPDVYEKAIEQSKIIPIGEPEFDPFPTLKAGEALEVKFKLQALPDFELGEYDIIPVQLNREVKVEESEVEEAVLAMRKRAAEFAPMTDDRGCAEPDRVTINYEIKAENAVLVDNREGLVLRMGEGEMLPEIENNIVGMKPGENKEFPVKYPENYQNPDLAGRDTTVTITLVSIESAKVPEIDEEFLKKIGNYADADAFKKDIEKQIRLMKVQRHEQEVGEQMIQRMVDTTYLEVPRKLVLDEIQERFDRYEAALEREGKTIEDWAAAQGKDLDEMKDEEYHSARNEVKRRIIFDRLFTQENMEIFPQELEMELLQYAYRNGLQKSDMKKLMKNREFLAHLRTEVRERKVMRLIRGRVKFMDDPAPEPKTDTETAKTEIETAAPADGNPEGEKE